MAYQSVKTVSAVCHFGDNRPAIRLLPLWDKWNEHQVEVTDIKKKRAHILFAGIGSSWRWPHKLSVQNWNQEKLAEFFVCSTLASNDAIQ
jgi:hypothetical protein